MALHARWDGAGAAVWGEHAGSPTGAVCYLEHADLVEAAAGLPVDGDPAWTEVEVPAGGGVANPSPWAGGPEATAGAPTAGLVRTAVPALRCTPLAVFALAASLDALPARVQVADTLRWLAVAADVAVDLCSAGRVLPALRTRADGLVACWEAAPLAGDDRVRALGACAPAALGADGTEVVDALVDALARDALMSSRVKSPRRGDAVSAWIAGLRSTGGSVDADPAAAASVADRLEAWAHPADESAALSTCLRLVPPSIDADDRCGPTARADTAEPADVWRIEFLLRARDDPSLLVPAADVWAEAGTLQWFDQAYEPPQDRLLADLGRAARLWPPLGEALEAALPVAIDTDAATALEFLRDAVPLLEAAGLEVQVPAVFGPAAKLGVRLRVRPSAASEVAVERGVASGLLGADGICDYDWAIAIGDDVLDAAELSRLAELKQPLVRHRGKWVQVDVAAVEAALKFVEAGRDSGRLTGVEVLRAATGLEAPDVDLPVVSVEAGGWVERLLEGSFAAAAPVPTPAAFAGELRAYQERGLGWLRFMSEVGLGAILADDMGLGKTAQLLALLADEAERGVSRGATLLVCPTSVLGNWQGEAARFTPSLAVATHYGADRPRGDAVADAFAGRDLVLTTYGVLTRDVDALRACGFDRVVLDEAQLVKSSSSGASRAARAIPARHHVALTGTPVENRLGDLWSIMEFVNPGLLGSSAGFRRAFAVPIERYQDDEAAALLARLTRPFVLRRVKTEPEIAPDLPDKIEIVEHCPLTREQATLYQAVVDDMLAAVAESEGVQRRGLVLATIAKLKAVCNHPVQFLGDASPLENRSGKLVRLEEILEAVLSAGDRALVFTQFAAFGARLARHLADTFGIETAFLHGGVKQSARESMVQEFQSGDGAPVMLASLRAGGVGLNLTAASHVIHYDRWWNPAVEDQATDRAYRIGAERDVMVRKLVCRGTIEDRIDAVLEAKRGLAAAVIGTGEDWLTSLDVEELRELVMLSRDAVDNGDG